MTGVSRLSCAKGHAARGRRTMLHGLAPGEVWFDIDVLWFNEKPRPALAFAGPAPAAAGRSDPERPRRIAATACGEAAQAAFSPRRRGRARGRLDSDDPSRRSSLRLRRERREPLVEDPPSLSFRLAPSGARSRGGHCRRRAEAARARALDADIDWRSGTSRGLPFGGSLSGGTQLPQEGPELGHVGSGHGQRPERAGPPLRQRAHDPHGRQRARRLPRGRPDAPRVVVGDISFRGGGPMDEHVSHQNGLDVDVYYPRRDDPAGTGRHEPDRPRPRQDLLNRFVAAGAQMVFVGFSTGLHGPGGVVIPYPNHENHMHVRFPPPAARLAHVTRRAAARSSSARRSCARRSARRCTASTTAARTTVTRWRSSSSRPSSSSGSRLRADRGGSYGVRALRRADAAGGRALRAGRPRPRRLQPAQVAPARARGQPDDPAAAFAPDGVAARRAPSRVRRSASWRRRSSRAGPGRATSATCAPRRSGCSGRAARSTSTGRS